jgi:hypothetical protein
MCSCYLKHFYDRGCSNPGEYIPIFVAAMCVVWLSSSRGVVMQLNNKLLSKPVANAAQTVSKDVRYNVTDDSNFFAVC